MNLDDSHDGIKDHMHCPHTVCTVIHFLSFHGLPGHLQKFNPRIIMVLAITHSDYKMAKFSTYSARCKHDYNIEQRTKGSNTFCVI